LLQLRHLLLKLLTLGKSAAVVPQYRRADNLIAAVEQSSTMHLAGQANGLYPGQTLPLAQLLHTLLQRLPPMRRLLLRPQRMGPAYAKLCADTVDNGTIPGQ